MPQENNDQVPMVTMTQEQFDKLIADQNEERKRNQEMWSRVLTQPTQEQTMQEDPITVDLNGLPDPTADNEGFNKGLGERMSQAYAKMAERAERKALESVRGVQEGDQLFNNAWNMLGEKHPELKEFPDLVESAANKVYADLRGRGIDPRHAFRNDMENVVENIATKAMDTFNRIKGIENNNTEIDDTSDDGRGTTMLQGKAPARTKPKNKEDNVSQDDFIGSLKKLQHDMHIY